MFDEFWKTQEATPQTPEHAKAHERIGMWGVVSMFVFLLLGLGFGATVLWNPDLPKLVNGLVAGATIAGFTAAGLGLGVAAGCLRARRDFFNSPAGRGWLRLVGTRSITALQVICIIVVATVLPLAGIAVYFAVRSFNGQ